MRALVACFLALSLLTSCAANPMDRMKSNISRFAEDKFRDSLAGQLVKGLGQGIHLVVNELARPGGYLDNPLVRILLPPPVNLALGLIRDIQARPDVNPLLLVMNRAAETAVPGAAPVLLAALDQIDAIRARGLLDAGKTAATDYLKEQTENKLKETLTPVVMETLAKNNGFAQYEQLLAALHAQRHVRESDPAAPPTFDEPQADLADYVVQQTINGLFKAIGVEEERIRDDLDRTELDLPEMLKTAEEKF
ncbi:MAG: DUF4197 domain-containing protein [Trichloromonas sp.]|jgi:hypothetical protein|nr:DUF4197 domain-containing protein [Trichloromonas sp.]